MDEQADTTRVERRFHLFQLSVVQRVVLEQQVAVREKDVAVRPAKVTESHHFDPSVLRPQSVRDVRGADEGSQELCTPFRHLSRVYWPQQDAGVPSDDCIGCCFGNRKTCRTRSTVGSVLPRFPRG